MKWFQPIECDNTVDNPLICDYDNLETYEYDQFSFKVGKQLTIWQENIVFKASCEADDGDPDDALQNHLMLPIYSERLITKLNESRISGIQYLPITLLRPNDCSINGFCIANFLHFIEAFDYSKSKYELYGKDFLNPNKRGQISGVRKFVLIKERLLGYDIIRLKEYKQRFFVSEKFRDVFESSGFTGYSFREVQLVEG